MFKNCSDIIVKGGCFSDETKLHGILAKPLNILYGPNGSGKTTVSRCLASLSNPSAEYSAQLPGVDAQQLASSVFVFNEDFVDKNVKIANHGLEPIMIFGESIGIQKREDELSTEIGEAEAEKEELMKTSLDLAAEVSSLRQHLENVLKASFSEIDMEIKGNRKRSPLKLEDFDDCKSLDSDTDLDSLKEQFKSAFSKYRKIISDGAIEWNRPEISISPMWVEQVNALLDKVLQKEDVSERDLFIFQLAHSHDLSHYIGKTQTDILQPSAERCPLCHQPISGNYRDELRHSLKLVLNEERSSFVAELEDLEHKLTEISIELPNLPSGICTEELALIQTYEAQLNALINEIRQRLSYKKDHLYDVVENIDLQDFSNKYQGINSALDAVQTEVSALNDIALNKQRTKEKLLKLNKRIAYLKNRLSFEQIAQKSSEASELQSKIRATTALLQTKGDEMTQLRMDKANAKIALGLINRCLAYVFYDENRLYLEYEDDKYVLKSKGRKVTPSKVSTGERNIIALSYFFTSIYKGKNSDCKEFPPALIVIDDPITSFDCENRIGVFTLIKWQLEEIFRKSRNSKALIMSHDQRTVFDLFEIQQQIAFTLKLALNENDEKRTFFNLRKRCVENNSPVSEYEVELQNIYDFAVASQPDDANVSVTIGNQMRRVLEHYAKIMYNGDYVSMMQYTRYHIQNLSFKDPLFHEIVESYKHFLSRMVVNTESHSAKNSYEDFEPRFRPMELQKYARYLLCFILDTNQSHLYAFLKKEKCKKVLDIHRLLFGV